MSPQKKTPSISDRELRQTLASLREDVAAPADFRAKLMQRLQREGIVPAPAQPKAVEPSLGARLAAFFTPARLGLAASAALALIVVLRFLPSAGLEPKVAPQPLASASAAANAAAPKAHAHAHAVVASKPVKKNSQLASAQRSTETFVGEEQSQTMPETASVGDQGAAAPSTGLQAASVPVDPKPTYVIIDPTPTPMTQPLDGNSQLRGNVVRASQGEAAVLVYRVTKPGHVHVELFDRLGHSVAVLRDTEQGPGVYDLRWAGGADRGGLAASGIYVMQVQAPGYQVQHKLLLVK